MTRHLRALPSPAVSEHARAQVLAAAAAVLASDSGASLARIAEVAGVGRTTIHRAFPTRTDLLTALAVQAAERLRLAIEAVRIDEGPVPDVLDRVARAILPLADELQFLDAGPEVWDLPELKDAWWSITTALDGLVQRGQREGSVRGDVPAEVVVEAFSGMIWGIRQGVRDGRVAPATASRHLVTLVIEGLRPPGGPR